MNEVQVSLDDVGRVLLRRAGEGSGVYTLETTEALRAIFQAERDDALGRWRDTENKDMVAYRTPEEDDEDGRCILLLNETTGDTNYEWERLAYSGPGLRYFDAHQQPEPEPEPKPWEAAKPGEVWLVTCRHCEPQICQVLSSRKFLPTQTETGYQPPVLPLDHPTIITAHKIWPKRKETTNNE